MSPARAKNIVVCIYALGALVTFGHAWQMVNRDAEREPRARGMQIIVAPFAALAWPLYWSVRAWEKQP